MKRVFLLAVVCVSLSLAALAAVNVTVVTPINNSQVGSPFNVVAHATSSYTIVGWHIYLDGNDVYSGGQTTSITAPITAGAGNHQVVTRAWDSSGTYGSVYQQITVTSGGGGGDGGGGNGLPTPPQGAIVFNNIQNRGNWRYCNAPGCAGGDGDGAYWMAQHQGNPSRSGSSTEFFNSGVWDNALWTQKLGANNNVHNFLWDFYFYVDSNSQNATQALEFDAFQFVSGYNYMIGSQCDYGRGLGHLGRSFRSLDADFDFLPQVHRQYLASHSVVRDDQYRFASVHLRHPGGRWTQLPGQYHAQCPATSDGPTTSASNGSST